MDHMWDRRERKVKDDSKFLAQAIKRMELPQLRQRRPVGGKELRQRLGVEF